LHMAQLMPLPLTVSCFSKIQIGFTFLVPAHPGSPGQRAVKRVWVCVFCAILQGNECCVYTDLTTASDLQSSSRAGIDYSLYSRPIDLRTGPLSCRRPSLQARRFDHWRNFTLKTGGDQRRRQDLVSGGTTIEAPKAPSGCSMWRGVRSPAGGLG